MRPARFPLVDSLRAIAALSVVLYHSGFYVHGLDGTVTRYVAQHQAGFPALGVVVFFAISGFLLHRPFVQARHDGRPRPALAPYAVRRAARIVPAYWLALAVEALVLGLGGVFTAHGLLTYFGFLQVYDVRTLQGGMGQAWTLDVEVTFYAALALLALAISRWRSRGPDGFLARELSLCAVLAAGSIAWQVLVLERLSPSSTHYYGALLSLPASMDLFAVGMALAVVSVARPGLRWRGLAALERHGWIGPLVAAAAYVLLMQSPSLFPGRGTGSWLAQHELRGLLAAGLLLPAVLGARDRGLVRRTLGLRPLRWLGKVSYGIYLWHVLVLVELQRHLGSHVWAGAFVALAVVGTLIPAALSWYGVERHVIGLSRRVGRSGPIPGTAGYAPSSSR